VAKAWALLCRSRHPHGHLWSCP